VTDRVKISRQVDEPTVFYCHRSGLRHEHDSRQQYSIKFLLHDSSLKLLVLEGRLGLQGREAATCMRRPLITFPHRLLPGP